MPPRGYFPENKARHLAPEAAQTDVSAADAEADLQPYPAEKDHENTICPMDMPKPGRVEEIVDQSRTGSQSQTPAQPGGCYRRGHPSSRRQPDSRGSS